MRCRLRALRRRDAAVIDAGSLESCRWLEVDTGVAEQRVRAPGDRLRNLAHENLVVAARMQGCNRAPEPCCGALDHRSERREVMWDVGELRCALRALTVRKARGGRFLVGREEPARREFFILYGGALAKGPSVRSKPAYSLRHFSYSAGSTPAN